MGRGVSSGGGQSSLGYLFGTDEAPKPAAALTPAASAAIPGPAVASPSLVKKPSGITPPADITKAIPGNGTNNYLRADGQNTGNFITDRPWTKVHAAPGGGSSLGYLFGDGGKK